MRMQIDGLAPARPTVTRKGALFVATTKGVWRIGRGDQTPPNEPWAALPAAPVAQRWAVIVAFSARGRSLFEKPLGSPARGLAIGRGRVLYAHCQDGTVWKVSE